MSGRRQNVQHVIHHQGPPMRGAGFFDDVLGGLKTAGKFIANNKLISRGGAVLDKFGIPYAGTIGKYAGAVGLGRKKKRRARKPKK